MITQSKAFFKSQKIAKACSFTFKASDTYLVDKKSKGVGSRMRLAKTELMWTENFVIFEEIQILESQLHMIFFNFEKTHSKEIGR